MLTSDVLAYFDGSRAKLAEALGITRVASYQWGEYPPVLRQLQLQEITNGKLRVEFPPAKQKSAA